MSGLNSLSELNSLIGLKMLLLWCGLLLLSGCQQPVSQTAAVLTAPLWQQSHIIATENNTSLTPDELVARLSQAPLLIVGEQHSNSDHHLIEQWLLERLAQQRPQGSLLLEMLSLDQQPLVNEVKRALAAGSYLREARIQELLQWDTGWHWALYRGLVLSALQGQYPLLAANLDQRQLGVILQTSPALPGEQTASNTARSGLATLIKSMHGGNIAPRQLTAMLAVQQYRDRLMAEQLLQAPRPALLFAGGVHAAKDLGVPLHIQDLHGDKPLVLMLATTGDGITASQADYVWYTPANAP